MTPRAIALALIAATPASAEVVFSGYNRMALVPPEPPCVALIEVINRHGVYNRTQTLETDHGPVSVHYETVGAHNATDHDLIDVVDLPEGLTASPVHMALPDGETGHICLMKWEGA